MSNLLHYFRDATPFRHYVTDCSLRATVDEMIEKHSKQRDGKRFRLFLVLEWEARCDTVMDEGTCFVIDQRKVVGGKAGEEAIMAWRAASAPWPETDDGAEFTNLVLAAVKIVQDEAEAIREVAAVSCFYDANRKAVYPMSMSMSAAASVYSPLSSLEVDARVGKFRKIVDAFEAGQQDERIRVVINSLRLEQIDNDDYRRGWYLCLFEAIRAMLSGRYKQGFHQRHRKYRKIIGHPKPGTTMDMEQFRLLQRDAMAELPRIYLDE